MQDDLTFTYILQPTTKEAFQFIISENRRRLNEPDLVVLRMLFNHVTDVRELCVQILLQVLQQYSPVVPVEMGKTTIGLPGL